MSVFWFRRGRPYALRGHAVSEPHERFAISLDDDIDWFPSEALYIARGAGSHREVAVAHVAAVRGPLLIAELLAPWRRYDRKRDRLFAARLTTTYEAPGFEGPEPATVLNISLSGIRLLVETLPSHSPVTVTLFGLDGSAALPCAITGVVPAEDRLELRLEFIDVSAHAMVALHRVLAHMHSAEEGTGETRAA